MFVLKVKNNFFKKLTYIFLSPVLLCQIHQMLIVGHLITYINRKIITPNRYVMLCQINWFGHNIIVQDATVNIYQNV